MSQLFGSTTSTATTTTVGDLKQDVELTSPPEDSISDVSFSPAPQADFLAVTSWDKKVRIYEISSTGQSQGKHLYEHDAPVFSCDFSKVGPRMLAVSGHDLAVPWDAAARYQGLSSLVR